MEFDEFAKQVTGGLLAGSEASGQRWEDQPTEFAKAVWNLTEALMAERQARLAQLIKGDAK